MSRSTQQRRTACRRVADHEEVVFGSGGSGEPEQHHMTMGARVEEPYREDTEALGGLDSPYSDWFEQYVNIDAGGSDASEPSLHHDAGAQLPKELDELACPWDETQHTPALQTSDPQLGGWGPENILQPEDIRPRNFETQTTQTTVSPIVAGSEDQTQREWLQDLAATASSFDHHNLVSNLAASGIVQPYDGLPARGNGSSVLTGPSDRLSQPSAIDQYTTPETSFGSFSGISHNYSASFFGSTASTTSTGRIYRCQHKLADGSLCGASFHLPSALKKHETSHLEQDQRPFFCSECGKYRSNKKADVKRHRLSKHTSKKPFWCALCQKGFARKDNLNRHWKSAKFPAPKSDLERSLQLPTIDGNQTQSSPDAKLVVVSH